VFPLIISLYGVAYQETLVGRDTEFLEFLALVATDAETLVD